MHTFEGKLVSQNIRVGIVAARFNEFIVNKLVGGAMDALLRHDVREEDIDLAWVPGAFEIPLIAKKMAESGKYDAVICLGAVIRHEDFSVLDRVHGAGVDVDVGVELLDGHAVAAGQQEPCQR